MFCIHFWASRFTFSAKNENAECVKELKQFTKKVIFRCFKCFYILQLTTMDFNVLSLIHTLIWHEISLFCILYSNFFIHDLKKSFSSSFKFTKELLSPSNESAVNFVASYYKRHASMIILSTCIFIFLVSLFLACSFLREI